MKVKELKRTVNVSWSPASHYPVMLATGTAAQQVDSSFSSSAYLELYSLNLNDPGYDMEVKTSIPSQHKFQKLVWSSSGTLVGGCDGGLLQFYNIDRLLKGATDSLVASSNKHSGHVSALDVNPFQKNLLASGASESEIFIWDLNNTSNPMAPGNKSQPLEHVQDLAWNREVQHILASTFATRCVVWDLRKNEPIMKLSDAQSRTKWRSVCWHPSIATQLCIASEDDQVPVIQLWDLRLAASPLVTLERHQKGVLALSWCQQDPDLLLSAGKDGKLLCWNPNKTTPGGEFLSEISSEGQWVFDVAWCPRNPCLVASSSFDGHVNIYSVNGGTKPNVVNKNSNIMDSFLGMDTFNQLPVISQELREPQQVSQLLPHPPRWAHRPVRAKFAFGGKLVSFGKEVNDQQKHVYISQVVTEPDTILKASQLDAVLGAQATADPEAAARLALYCRQRADSAVDQQERYMWFFLKANFEPDFRSEILNLLGFKQDDITSKFKNAERPQSHQESNVDSITSGVAGLSRGESSETDAELSTDTSTDLSDAHTLIERKLTGEFTISPKEVKIPNADDLPGMICRALISGHIEEAVELCLEAHKMTDALVIASLGTPDLLFRTQKYYLNVSSYDPVSVLARTLMLSKWDSFVSDTSSKSWKEALATIVTHCDVETMAVNCELLGARLAQDKEPALADAATLCYLCSLSVDVLVERWQRRLGVHSDSQFTALAQLVELALLARKAAVLRGRTVQPGGKLESVLTDYALRLASQGNLEGALNSLEGVTQPDLRHRIECALLRTQPYLYGGRGQHYSSQTGYGQQNTTSNSQWWSGGNRTRTDSGNRTRVDGGHAPAAPVQRKNSSVPQPRPLAADVYNPGQPIHGGYEHSNSGWTNSGPSVPTPAAPPPLQAAPRPGSVGPQPAGGITARGKRVVDPSVQSNVASFSNQYNYLNQPVAAQPAPLNHNFNYNATTTPMYGTDSMYTNQTSGFGPVTNGASGGYQPATFVPEPVAPGPAVPPPPATSSAPGWNDPPMPSKVPPKQDYSTPAPITHPLFGVDPSPQHIPLVPGAQYPQQTQYQAPQYGVPGQQNPGYQGGPPAHQMHGHMPAQQKPESPAPALAAEPIVKAPIPEQHIHMQTVFDALRAHCAQVAANPQMKRKLEDVQRRLETLYDLLRENRLSENALAALHMTVQQIQGGNYENALNVLTNLATGPDFASVASFLPGLKVLIQVASQAQVYLR